jgi:hypothetical protein
LLLSSLGALRSLIPPGPNVILPLLILCVILVLAIASMRPSRAAAIMLALFLLGWGGLHLFLVLRALGTHPNFMQFWQITLPIILPAIFFSSVWLCTGIYLMLSPGARKYYRGHGANGGQIAVHRLPAQE